MKKKIEIISELKMSIERSIAAKKIEVYLISPKEASDLYSIEKFKYDPKPSFIKINFYWENKVVHLVGEVVSGWGSAILRSKIQQLKQGIRENKIKGTYPVIIGKYLSKNQREICREENVFYIDLVGNFYIHYPGVYIDKEVESKGFPSEEIERNPFSDKASLILRKLLKESDKQWQIRKLAIELKLSPGYVSKIAKRLSELDYASFNSLEGLKLKNPSALLEDWVHRYNYKKNKHFKYFCLAKGPEDIFARLKKLNIPYKINYALGLHAGACLISPHAIFNEVHIYVSDKESMDFFVDKLKLKPVVQGANLIMLFPYYKHSVFYDKQKIRDIWVVSDIQLYVDLYKYPLRGIEQAEHLYEKRLKNLIEIKGLPDGE